MKTKQLFSKSICTALFAGALFLSSSAVFAQVKIGTNPTVIGATNNLEVEASGGSKVAVDKTTGKVTIADGSQGAAKVLTSDANGVATWQVMRTTALSSFAQAAPGISIALGNATGTCFPSAGSPPPSCATDINQGASFSITNPVNDVIIDLVDLLSVTNNTTTVYFNIGIFVDKTTPGVFEYVGGSFITYSNIGCGSSAATAKIAIKNLAVRANYNVKVYYTPWVNTGATANIGIGAQTTPGSGCGSIGSYADNKLIVSVSQ